MKRLTKIPSESLENLYFDMCLKSNRGCNVVVDGKYYNVYVNTFGEYVVTEFVLDYELTKEEFKRFKNG
jgi:hypothetical protein